MELLFTVESVHWVDSVGWVLSPGPGRLIEMGTPLFLVTPDGTQLTARSRLFSPRMIDRGPPPLAIDLSKTVNVPVGTRVFGRGSSTQ